MPLEAVADVDEAALEQGLRHREVILEGGLEPRALKHVARFGRHREHRAPTHRRPPSPHSPARSRWRVPPRTLPTTRRTSPARRDPVALAAAASRRQPRPGHRHLGPHLRRADPAGQARGRDRRRRGRRSRRCGPGDRAAGPGEGAGRAALRASRRDAPRSSRRWTPRTPRTVSAPRTSPTPSATRTSTPPPSCATTAEQARGARSGAEAAARRPGEDASPTWRRSTTCCSRSCRSRALLYDKVHTLVVDGTAEARRRRRRPAPRVCPVKGVVVFTDDFGELRPGGPHPGHRHGRAPDTPVVAVADGFCVTTSAKRAATARGSPVRQRLLLLRALLAVLRGRRGASWPATSSATSA